MTPGRRTSWLALALRSWRDWEVRRGAQSPTRSVPRTLAWSGWPALPATSGPSGGGGGGRGGGGRGGGGGGGALGLPRVPVYTWDCGSVPFGLRDDRLGAMGTLVANVANRCAVGTTVMQGVRRWVSGVGHGGPST